MTQELRFKIVGMNINDELLIRSIVRVSASRFQVQWRFADEAMADADVYMGPEQHQSLKEAMNEQASIARKYCIGVVDPNETRNPKLTTLTQPLRAAEVIEALLTAEKSIKREASNESFETLSNKAIDSSAQYALELTQAIQRETVHESELDLLLSLDGKPQIRIRVTDGKFSGCNGEKLAADDGESILRALNWLKYKIDVSKKNSDESIDANPAEEWLPLDSFYWHLGVRTLSHQLLPGLDNGMRFKLKHWPDFGRNGSEPSHVKLAALMVRRALQVVELEKITRISKDAIVAFINACALCNLLQPVDQSGQVVHMDLNRLQQSSDKPANGLSNVFTAIRSVFGMRAS